MAKSFFMKHLFLWVCLALAGIMFLNVANCSGGWECLAWAIAMIFGSITLLITAFIMHFGTNKIIHARIENVWVRWLAYVLSFILIFVGVFWALVLLIQII